MARPLYWKGGIKGAVLQTAVTNEANTDAGAAWAAGESTLANSLKVKVNAILAALRASKIVVVGSGGGKPYFVAGVKGRFAGSNVTDEATANTDATYAQTPEGDILTSMKAKINAIITAMTNAKIIGGHTRYITVGGRKVAVTQPAIAPISIADADATYTSGGAGEQGLANEIKTKVNAILAALRAAKIIVT